ncbi:MAG: trehalose 6-phosphate synthase [Spirochaetota bacterium]
MNTLADFYDLMAATVTIRRDLVSYYLIDVAKPTRLEALREVHKRLTAAPTDGEGRLILTDDEGREVPIQADYEILELEKDLHFFENGEASFASFLNGIHPRFGEETKELVDFLRDAAPREGTSPTDSGGTETIPPHGFDLFITDRDGTVNNYCARYRSSVQSAYNAVFLSRFGSTLPERPIILTSAPLQDLGIVDLTVMPDNTYVLAGSKGREYRDLSGARIALPVTELEERKLTELNSRLEEFLEEPRNRIFGFIGSSLQKKHGETTVARQDVNASVPEAESERFKEQVRAAIDELNDDAEYFRLDDTGKDLEIIPTISGGTEADEPRHFDKGDGVAFLAESLNRDLADKQVLVCGDTSSDVPMVRKSLELGAQVTTLFVTTDTELQSAVRETGAKAHFVSTPDVLVSGLDLVTKGDEE